MQTYLRDVKMGFPEVLGVFCLLGMALSCDPKGQEHLPTHADITGMVYFSHAVVVGRIVNLIPTPMLSPNAYTVLLQVDCVIKDLYNSVTTPNVNITEAGFIEGLCHSAEFVMGYSYIAFLRKTGNEYKPWEMPADNTPDNIAQVMKACDLHPAGNNCPSIPTATCTPDTSEHSKDQVQQDEHHDHDDHDDHEEEHDHHDEEDADYTDTHASHHDGDFEHDHDHEDHHHDHSAHDHSDEGDHHEHTEEHEHEHDEDVDYDHDHYDHHNHEDDFEHDHDHSMHHENEVNDNAAAAQGKGSTCRNIMTATSLFAMLIVAKFLH